MLLRMREAKQTETVDILFLGSSHTYRGFDPRIFRRHGFTSFNMGSSAQTHIQTELLLKRYLDTINPSLVIYEVYPAVFTSDGVESSLDIISNDSIHSDLIQLASEYNHVKIYHTLFYAAYRDFLGHGKHHSENDVEKRFRKSDIYVNGGFVERSVDDYASENLDAKRWNFRGNQFDAFERNLNFIEARDIPYILVYAPITNALYDSYSNNQEFDDRMHTYGEYLNFNELVETSDNVHFYDISHLNQRGVELFNEKLLNILKESEIGSALRND